MFTCGGSRFNGLEVIRPYGQEKPILCSYSIILSYNV